MNGPLVLFQLLAAVVTGSPVSGISSQASIPVPVTPIDPNECLSHWAPVMDLLKESLDQIVALLLSPEPVISNVDKLVQNLEEKEAARFTYLQKLATGNVTLPKSGKELKNWVLGQQKVFKEFDKSSAAELDSVFDKLTPELRALVKGRCELFRKAVDVAANLWNLCMKTNIAPLAIGEGECPFSTRIDQV